MNKIKINPNENELKSISEFFKVLSDRGRLSILYLLIEDELCVGEIAKRLNMSPSLVSHQLRVLRQSHLVSYEKRGKQSIYKLDDTHISNLIETAYEHLEHKGELK